MNRRSFVQSLAALTFAGSSASLLTSLGANEERSPVGKDSLQQLLKTSRQMCEFLRLELPLTDTSLLASLEELAALIEEAQRQLENSQAISAAFWQSCADAFDRAAQQLESRTAVQTGSYPSITEIHRTFRQSARRAAHQTSVTIASLVMHRRVNS